MATASRLAFTSPQARCATCKAYDTPTGECRLNPPTVVWNDIGEHTFTVFPDVAEDEWCRQHWPKDH